MPFLTQTVIRALTRGFIDSLKGTVVIFYLDKSINEKARRGSIPQEISKLRRVSEHPAVKQQKPQKYLFLVLLYYLIECRLL